MSAPTVAQIEAAAGRARAAIGELRGFSANLRAELTFARWLAVNDPGEVDS